MSRDTVGVLELGVAGTFMVPRGTRVCFDERSPDACPPFNDLADRHLYRLALFISSFNNVCRSSSKLRRLPIVKVEFPDVTRTAVCPDSVTFRVSKPVARSRIRSNAAARQKIAPARQHQQLIRLLGC